MFSGGKQRAPGSYRRGADSPNPMATLSLEPPPFSLFVAIFFKKFIMRNTESFSRLRVISVYSSSFLKSLFQILSVFSATDKLGFSQPAFLFYFSQTVKLQHCSVGAVLTVRITALSLPPPSTPIDYSFLFHTRFILRFSGCSEPDPRLPVGRCRA